MQRAPDVPGYDVHEPLGAGATSTVWAARRRADELEVALKVVPVAPEDCADRMGEVAALSAVRHEHVLKLYDVLALPGPDGRAAALALAVQRADGGSLAQVLAARGHLRPGEVVTVLTPLARALEQLHAAGVLHGDLSPGNVLFHADGKPVLSDLGVARVFGGPRLEPHGTDGMVAPEVLEGLEPMPESDVYGLGALAWLCLTGDTPGWVGGRQALADLVPDVPEPLRELVEDCLAPEPEDRPRPAEVATRAHAAARAEPVEVAPGAEPEENLTRRVRDLARRHQAQQPDQEGDRAAGPWWRSRRVLLGVAAVAVLLVALTAGPPVARSVAAWVTQEQDSAVAGPAAVVVGESGSAEPLDADRTAAAPSEGTGATDPAATDPVATDPVAGESGSAEPPPTADPPSAAAGPDLRTDPAAVLQGLLDTRAEAWASGELSRLLEVHAPGSFSLRQDREALGSALADGLSYEGVSFEVGDVRVTSRFGEGEEVGAEAVLEAEVRRGGYVVVGPAEHREEVDERRETVTLRVARTDQGWRLAEWSAGEEVAEGSESPRG